MAELPENVRAVMQTLQNPALAGQLNNLLNANNNPAAPKAHLNVLFFNDKMELVPGSSTAVQVTGNSGNAVWNTISAGQQITSPGSGYVLIYIDNQSTDKQVWMDNVLVQHYTSEVLEEEHYYPFGLTLNTSLASGAKEQPYKLTTKELEKSFDLNMYDFGARMQDMQLGRWWSIDPLAEQMRRHSPYNYAFDNPVMYVDPDGMTPTDFYNLNADKVKHVEDGKNDKKIVLTTSKKEDKVNKAIEGGAVVTVPSNEVVDQMSNAFDRSEKTGKEYGFVVGKDGKSSITVTGEDRIVTTGNWIEATDDLTSKGDEASYDVHVHPLTTDGSGNVVEFGVPLPSETDKKATPYSDHPNAVLGYDEVITPAPAGVINGASTNTYVRSIGYYNQNGTVHKKTTINFGGFSKTVKKINEQ